MKQIKNFKGRVILWKVFSEMCLDTKMVYSVDRLANKLTKKQHNFMPGT